MIIKNGVNVVGLRKEIIVVLPTIYNIVSSGVSSLVITSALDGTHMVGSRHYEGLAIDIRLPYGDKDSNIWVTKILKMRLGTNYDVVLENNHIHIEFDPK